MTFPCTGTKICEWLTYWNNATTAGNMVPPRDPDDDEDEDENEENEDENEEDEDRNDGLDTAVIREPDE
jgi:hypothetical protein